MTVFQNYIIEISADNVRYTTIADYSQGGSVPHITDGANTSDIAFIPADYNITRNLPSFVGDEITIGQLLRDEFSMDMPDDTEDIDIG